MTRKKHTVFIGLGSNVGNRLQQLRRAARSLIDTHPTLRIPIITAPRLSSIYETEPIGIVDQSKFLNAVMVGETTLEPDELLFALKHIEQELGRVPRIQNGPREIDLDILLMNDVGYSADPTIPHPRLVDRAFVLAPLCELAPDHVHPCGKSLKTLLAHVGGSSVRKTDLVWFVDRSDDTTEIIPTFTESEFETFSSRRIVDAMNAFGVLRLEFDASSNVSHTSETFRLLASRLFDLPDDVLATCMRNDGGEGYTPPGVEGVRGHASDFLRHFWDFRPGVHARMTHDVAAFSESAEHVMTLALPPCFRIFKALDRFTLSSTPHRSASSWRIAEDAQGGSHLLRVSHYLNQSSSSLDVLFPSHQDFGLLTAYIGGSSHGLQMKLNGVWHDVYNPPGSIILAAGTTLKMLCPDVRAVTHRVVGSSVGRVAMVLFTELRPEILLPNGKTNSNHLAAMVRSVRKSQA